MAIWPVLKLITAYTAAGLNVEVSLNFTMASLASGKGR